MRWVLCVFVAVLGCDEDLPAVSDGGGADGGAGGAVADGTTGGGDADVDAVAGDGPLLDMGQPEEDGAISDGTTGDGPAADGSESDGPAADGPATDGSETDAAADGAESDGPEADAAPDGPEADAGAAENCSECGDDADCAALGDGAVCALGRCSARCEDNDDCPAHFTCLLNQCAPAGFNCMGCAVTGCADDERCGGDGQCQPLGERCAICADDGECAEGFFCRQVGASRNCVEACDEGACGEGFECDNGGCKPASMVCDLCGGCVGEAPVCNVVSRECQACGVGTPCEAPLVCTPEGDCVEPEPGVECLTELDCREEGRPLCEEGLCIGCRDDSWCVAGSSCVDGGCAEGDACTGLACHGELACGDGACVDGCAADEDCGDEDAGLACNVETGQCYQEDQRCDAGGVVSVCAPGSICRPDPLNPNDTACSCLRANPDNFVEPRDENLIPCQPGGFCAQLGAAPGVCVAAP